jgi:hypothetical protein
MTFGTSSTARLLNMLPLNQRFTETAAKAMPRVPLETDDQNDWLLERVDAWGRDRGTAEGMPGWDADGREVT